MTATIQSLLDRARQARADGDEEQCLVTLEAAQRESAQLEAHHALVQVVAWKRSKAEYDFGSPVRMLDALDPVIDQPDPFAHYPTALDAVERLTRHFTDRVGYGDTRIDRLWTLWIAAQRRLGDTFLAEMGAMHVTWLAACRGEVDHLRAELNRVGAMSRKSFAGSLSKHIEAEDAGNSVFFVQMQVARAVLTGALWGHRERLGWEAWQLYEDAIEEVGHDRSADFWYLSTVARGGRRFGWPEAAATLLPLRRQLTERERDVHAALVAGEFDEDLDLLLWAADEAIATHAGFEWAIDALLIADGIAAGYRERADELAKRYGVQVFLGF